MHSILDKMYNQSVFLPIRYALTGEKMQTAKAKAIKIAKTVRFIVAVYALHVQEVLQYYA